jgi:alanyl-tRNA synthetase
VAKIKANEWLNQVTEKMNAKGGGKDNAAQATGVNTACLGECLDLASKFVQMKLD